MENNQENLGSQEPTTQTSSNTLKNINFKPIAIAVAVVAILVVLFFMIFTRSPEATVKAYIKAYTKANASKVMSLMDYEGAAAFSACTSYYSGETDFSKFEDEYEEIKETIKDYDKDEKKEYEEAKEELEDTLQDSLDELKDNKIKMSIKDIETKKVKEYKKITKVTAELTVKYDGEEKTSEVVFYTIKKGLKNYIISADI